MNRKITISEIMTKKVVVGNVLNTLPQLLQFFRLYKVQHLPIVEADNLVGIVSQHDIMDYLSDQILGDEKTDCASLRYNFNIRHVMTTHVTTVKSTDKIGTALEILGKASFQSLPVVDNGKLVGILTNKDLVKHMATEAARPANFSMNVL